MNIILIQIKSGIIENENKKKTFSGSFSSGNRFVLNVAFWEKIIPQEKACEETLTKKNSTINYLNDHTNITQCRHISLLQVLKFRTVFKIMLGSPKYMYICRSPSHRRKIHMFSCTSG